jgi:hypothetical protein
MEEGRADSPVAATQLSAHMLSCMLVQEARRATPLSGTEAAHTLDWLLKTVWKCCAERHYALGGSDKSLSCI